MMSDAWTYSVLAKAPNGDEIEVVVSIPGESRGVLARLDGLDVEPGLCGPDGRIARRAALDTAEQHLPDGFVIEAIVGRPLSTPTHQKERLQ